MIRNSVLIVSFVTLLSTAASAQSPQYKACLARGNGNRDQTFACNQREMRRQDKRVDADFRKLQIRAQHDPQKQADVRTDQRDWLQHRDFTCSKADESENLPCMIRETAAKADQLDARLR